jgi:hypothetical protein
LLTFINKLFEWGIDLGKSVIFLLSYYALDVRGLNLSVVSPVHLANIHASNIELNKSVESYE